MLRQSSSRNHRSKGLKLKKALQISLLVLVSVWLLYQVKHSYEKKLYIENEANDLHKDDKNQDAIIRLGRKDLPTRMHADLSILDERAEDEDNSEMEQEMKHDEDPIDEQDLQKDDDLLEQGGRSSDKDGDDVGVFEDEERKVRSQEDQEKTFHGDNASSAVSHDPPSSEQEELSHHAQEKILFVDDASTAVPHEKQETRHEEVRKAREKSFKGDDVSSSVDHDVKVTKPLPDEQLNTMDRIFEGTTNLSNGISFHGPGVNGSSATEGQHVATSTNISSHLNANISNIDSESNAHSTSVNLTSNHAHINFTSNGEKQVQLLTGKPSVELHSPANGTLSLIPGNQELNSDGDNDNNTGSSSTPVNNKVRSGDARKENVDRSTKIVNRAMTEDEVLPE